MVLGEGRAPSSWGIHNRNGRASEGWKEKEILPSFISQPTDVQPSKRRQAGSQAPQLGLTWLI